MKLKWFAEAGVVQHVVCFLLYCLEVTVVALLTVPFPLLMMLFFPITIWIVYLIFTDVYRILRWLWRLVRPKKRRGTPAAKVQSAASKPLGEITIFRMWEDAIVWKQGSLYLRERGEYKPITVEQAREKERSYHAYQASMDVNRGGTPREIAYKNRGFDEKGNYTRTYAVDRVLEGPIEGECCRCHARVRLAAMQERYGLYYCANCARQMMFYKPKGWQRCCCCGELLTLGEKVRIDGATYCRECANLQDEAQDQLVFKADKWRIVWNGGKLCLRLRNGGCRRINLLKARELERDSMRTQMQMAVGRGLMPISEAESRFGFRNGEYVNPYAVDALQDGRSGKMICDVCGGTLIWKDGGLVFLKIEGQYGPISQEEARKLERTYWSYRADHYYRMGAPEEYVQATGGFDRDGRQLKPYAVDEFLAQQIEGECSQCGAKLSGSRQSMTAPDFACPGCGGKVKIKD